MITFNKIKESNGCHFMPIRSIWYIQNQFSLRNFFGSGGEGGAGEGGRRKGAEEGEAPPRSPTLTLLNAIFDRKGNNFVYLPLSKGTPFTYLV